MSFKSFHMNKVHEALSFEDQLIWIQMGYSGLEDREFLKKGPTLRPYLQCSAKGGNQERR